MPYVTLPKQARYQYVSELSAPYRAQLLNAVRNALLEMDSADPETDFQTAAASRVVDLEDTVAIRYDAKEERLDAANPSAQHPSLFGKIASIQREREDVTRSFDTKTETPER